VRLHHKWPVSTTGLVRQASSPVAHPFRGEAVPLDGRTAAPFVERLTSKADGLDSTRPRFIPFRDFPNFPPSRYSLGKFHNEVLAYYGPH
jgi:hypothetical protein